jgi:hypothetical protein
MRLIARSTVLLPQPDGPMKAVILRDWRFKLTPLTASFCP